MKYKTQKYLVRVFGGGCEGFFCIRTKKLMSGFQTGDQNAVPILNPSSLEKHCVLGLSSATTQPRTLKKILPFRAFGDGQGCCFSTCIYNKALLLLLLLPLVFFRGLLPVLIWLLHQPSSLLLLLL
jgi:hypothetical protein